VGEEWWEVDLAVRGKDDVYGVGSTAGAFPGEQNQGGLDAFIARLRL
jgi:hypothetical protein